MSNKKSNLKVKSVLKLMKGPDTKQVGVTMPVDLFNRFNEFKKDVEKHGYSINISEICCDAIEDALENGKKEIANILMKKNQE